MSTIGVIILVVLILMVFGGYQYRDVYGPTSYGLPGILLLVVLILLLLGKI